MINSLEALADCIMRFEGWSGPGSTVGGVKGTTSWRNRNPGNLRDTVLAHTMDEKGYCVFNNLSNGWQALLIDLTAKCNGTSSHKLTPQSTLHDLFSIYAPPLDNNNPTHYTEIVAGYLTKIYNVQVTPSITLDEILKLGT